MKNINKIDCARVLKLMTILQLQLHINENDAEKLDEKLNGLKIKDDAEKLDEKLNDLKIKDDEDDADDDENEKKLIARSPATKVELKYKSLPRTTGGVTYYNKAKSLKKETVNISIPKTDKEILKLANSKEFYEFVKEQSLDLESVDKDVPKKMEKVKSNRPSVDSGYGSPEMDQPAMKDILKKSLNQDAKQAKWVKVVQMDLNDLFEVDNNGQSHLHKALNPDVVHGKELFYALMEQMKRNPDRFTELLTEKLVSSLTNRLKETTNCDLLEYFNESINNKKQT